MDSTRELQFKEQVKKSFSSCKKDIESMQELISSQSELIQTVILDSKNKENQIGMLAQQLTESQNLTKDLLNELKEMKSDLQDFKKEQIQNSIITSNEESISLYEESVSNTSIPKQQIQQVEVPVVKSEPKPVKDPYEALLEFKAKLNKRDILKQKLMGIVPQEGMVLSELRFLFVEHFKYCSKATFYNYLKELELSKQVRIERENTKNMIYISGNVSATQTMNPQMHFQ